MNHTLFVFDRSLKAGVSELSMNCSEVSHKHEGFVTLKSYRNNIHILLHNSFPFFYSLNAFSLSLASSQFFFTN